MKNFALVMASTVALFAASSVSAADLEIKIAGANTAPVVAGQLNVGVAAINVGKSIELSNQAVGVNIDVESAQQVKKLDVNAGNTGLVAAVQVNGPVLAGGATSISLSNVAVGTNIKANLK